MAGDLHVFIKWSEPAKVPTKYGTRWVRSWVIPKDWLQGFFIFWNGEKDKLRAQGYSIGKNKLGVWTLSEWQLNKKDLREKFGKDNPLVVFDTPTESTLPAYIVKNVNGLREWQVPNVAKLTASLLKNKAAIDGSDTGSGKTYSAIATARELKFKIAVVCPKAVINSWKRAITNHFKLKYEFVLNYESVKTGKYKDIGVWQDVSRTSNKQFFKWNLPKNTLIIFDESHKLKGHGTQNSEMALEAKKQGYHILCCSATNAVSPVELKTVGLILGVYKRGKWRAFLEEHGCEQGRFGWEFNGDKNILKKLHHDLFIERGVRLSKRDIPNFPDCDTIVEAYNMDDKSEKDINEAYAEMERELTLLRIKCKNTKEYQINSMVIQLRARQRAELIKVPLLVEMAEDAIESGMSVVIFLNFSESVKALSKRLKTNCIVWGENKGNERQRNIDAFQADTERIIIVNVKAGGAGLSLHDLNGQFARMSLISPTPSAVDLRQALGRIHRDGAKSKALQKIIFVANTEEEKTCEKVKLKLENLDTINDGDVLIGNNL
jgi:superfamily II DNA or RNA helicase